MGIRSFFRNIARRFSGDRSGFYFTSGTSSTLRKGSRELLEAYGEQLWLHTAVNRLASETASAIESCWELYDAPYWYPKRKKVEDPNDPILSLLFNPCRGEMSPFEFWKLAQEYLELVGDVFLLVSPNALGEPAKLNVCPPHWMAQTPTKDRPFFTTMLTSESGEAFEVPEENCIWLRDRDPLAPYGRGIATAKAASDEIETDESAAQHTSAFFRNGGVPDHIVSANAKPEEMKAAKELFEQKYQGPKKAHQVHWANKELKVDRLDTAFKDMQLVELRKSSRDNIASAFTLPPELLGILQNSNRSTIDAAYYLFSKGALVPRCKRIAGTLQVKLVPKFRGPERYLGFRPPVPEDRDFQLRAISVNPSAFTNKELRELAGFLAGQNPDAPLTSGTSIAGETNLPPGRKAQLLREPAWAEFLNSLPSPKPGA